MACPALFVMGDRMTSSAKSLQIIEHIIPRMTRGCGAKSIPMMDVQVILTAAALTCVVVASQGSLAVAAEVVIIFCYLAIAGSLFGVVAQPLMDAGHLFFTLACRATALWSGDVSKTIAAVGALQGGSYRNSARLIPQARQGRFVLGASKLVTAIHANFLNRASRFKLCAARLAHFNCVSDPSLPVRSKGAWLAPLHIRRGFRGIFPTVWAGEKSIFCHNLHPKPLLSQHSVKADQ